MAINKVEYRENGQLRTLIDLTQDTVAIANVEEGSTFHLPSGVYSTGTLRKAVPIDVYSELEMSAVLISANVGKAYRYLGDGDTYIYGDIYIVEEE